MLTPATVRRLKRPAVRLVPAETIQGLREYEVNRPFNASRMSVWKPERSRVAPEIA